MNSLFLPHISSIQHTDIPLVGSKSESNRALIIQALTHPRPVIHQLSAARDTQTLQRLLTSDAYELDVLDAGTTMRFLTAFCAVTGRKARLTGTERMQQRPIGLLVDALRELGADIRYEKAEGYPPLLIGEDFQQQTDQISLRSDISSQYISALLLVAPSLPQGLTLTLEGPVSSKPYIDLTLGLMAHFGVYGQWKGNSIQVPPKPYQPRPFSVEADWSGASYWFSLVALAESGSLTLKGLKPDSLQGDRQIMKLMEPLGVQAHWMPEGLLLDKSGKPAEKITIDFTPCPDLAQTILPCCAALGVRGSFSGMHSLRVKETDRIAALQNELAKLGASLLENEEGIWELTPPESLPAEAFIATYDDHRMAMGFAPLATRLSLSIENPAVVNKSFPSFWDELGKTGIKAEG